MSGTEKLQNGSSYCVQQAEIRRLIWIKIQEIDAQMKKIAATKLFPPFRMPPLPTLSIPNPFTQLTKAMTGFDIIKKASWSCSVMGAIGGGLKKVGGAIISGGKAIGGAVAKGGKAVGGAISSGAKAVGGWFS